MANSANTQDILDNVTKKYMITNNSTTQKISEAAAAFAADPAHTKILAGGADKQTLDIYRTLVKVFRGENYQNMITLQLILLITVLNLKMTKI